MRSRCRNPRLPSWQRYGGRGITVCARWDDFSVFLADMGPRPSPEHSIERIDNDGHYEPGNCRWATQSEQTRNTRRNRWVELDGERVLLLDAVERSGLPMSVVWWRLKQGWSAERALREPKGEQGAACNGETIQVTYRGREMPLAEACHRARVPYKRAYDRLKAGWTDEAALTAPPRKYAKRTRQAVKNRRNTVSPEKQ